MLATASSIADCTEACDLIEGLCARQLSADKGNDSEAIAEQAKIQDMLTQIPPGKIRTALRAYHEYLHRHRHLVENAFLHIKQWRCIATRLAKSLALLLAALQIRCLAFWLKIS